MQHGENTDSAEPYVHSMTMSHRNVARRYANLLFAHLALAKIPARSPVVLGKRQSKKRLGERGDCPLQTEQIAEVTSRSSSLLHEAMQARAAISCRKPLTRERHTASCVKCQDTHNR